MTPERLSSYCSCTVERCEIFQCGDKDSTYVLEVSLEFKGIILVKYLARCLGKHIRVSASSTSRPSHRTLMNAACCPHAWQQTLLRCMLPEKSAWLSSFCSTTIFCPQPQCFPSSSLPAYSSSSCGRTILHRNGPITVWLLQQRLTPWLNVFWLGNDSFYLVPTKNPISPNKYFFV